MFVKPTTNTTISDPMNFEQIIDQVLSGILIMSKQQIIYANSYFFHIIGQNLGADFQWKDFIHPEDYELFEYHLEKVIYHKETTDLIELKLLKNDGTFIDVEMYFTPYLYENHTYALAYLRDITIRKRYEHALKKSEQKYRMLSENMSDVVSEQLFNGTWTYISPVSQDVFGYPREELIGQTIFEYIYDDDVEKIKKAYLEMEERGSPKTIYYRFKLKNGKYLWVENKLKLTKVIKEKRLISYIRDISDQIETEKRLKQSEKLAIIGELSAGVVHEMRNPLTSIKGFLQLMEAGTIKQDDYIKIIKAEINRMEKIANDLLSFSKPKDTLAPLNINQLISEVVLLMNGHTLNRNINIQWEPTLDHIYVLGESTQLKQVFINLIKNAIEAIDKNGNINIQSTVKEQMIILDIIDDGCGIPEHMLDKLGCSFHTTKDKGTGLGLMLTYKLIEHHGGSIKVNSEEGVGTTFSISLPLYDSQ
ncbi:PAS domain-containing sensor histidine kinase [Salirhabdus salicampi]|uniref:PAS domain-containing sensor histidine kinase n=1 Tax=Salirhabdus salicampi TaxID=476102 RepID=UPI0020C4306B|nr:PAS domain-containing sensor histidine kinase [Salirhabdus salicampi]MCP8616160.1 PAS domain S-box protein [Salirhabdus salicampi]